LADDFGRAAIVACREHSPSRYSAIVASLLPNELKLEQDSPFSAHSDEELAATLDLVRNRFEELEQGSGKQGTPVESDP
jgi:hypothetical protein